MADLLGLYVKLLWRSFAEWRWLHWLLGISFVIVLVGLVPVLLRGADPLLPFGILGIDLVYSAALSVLLLVLAFVLISVLGLPLFRYGGVWLMLLGIGILGYQFYGYARFGAWQPFALRDFTDVAFLTTGLDQASGLAKRMLRAFLEWTPLSSFFLVWGVVWEVFAKRILDHELQDLTGAERERFKPLGEARVRPKLAVPPGRWIPVRLYRRAPVEPLSPAVSTSFLGEGERKGPRGTGARDH